LIKTADDLFPRPVLFQHFLMMGPYLGLYTFRQPFAKILDNAFRISTCFYHIQIHKRLFDGPPSKILFTAEFIDADASFGGNSEVSLNQILFGLHNVELQAIVDKFIFNAFVGGEMEVGL